MSGYTPGPWLVCQDGTDIVALMDTPSALVVASTKFFEGPSTSWERANAHLIAAAPELLEAALFTINCVSSGDCDGTCIDRLGAAITKAEGREP